MIVKTTASAVSNSEATSRPLHAGEIEMVTGGALNCFPIFGDDGKMYSPTLDGYPGGPLRNLSGVWNFPTRPLGF